jgi:hypothetical protein
MGRPKTTPRGQHQTLRQPTIAELARDVDRAVADADDQNTLAFQVEGLERIDVRVRVNRLSVKPPRELWQLWVPVMPGGDDQMVVASLFVVESDPPGPVFEPLGFANRRLKVNRVSQVEVVGQVLEVLSNVRMMTKGRILGRHREVRELQLLLGGVDVKRPVGR